MSIASSTEAIETLFLRDAGRLAASVLLDSPFGERLTEVGSVVDDGVLLVVAVAEAQVDALSSGEQSLFRLLQGLGNARTAVYLDDLCRVDQDYRALALTALRMFWRVSA